MIQLLNRIFLEPILILFQNPLINVDITTLSAEINGFYERNLKNIELEIKNYKMTSL